MGFLSRRSRATQATVLTQQYRRRGGKEKEGDAVKWVSAEAKSNPSGKMGAQAGLLCVAAPAAGHYVGRSMMKR